MTTFTETNFVRQQGFPDSSDSDCAAHFSGLMFQPRIAAVSVVDGFLVGALVALVVGRLCLGSYIFHLLRGHAAFASETLPWAHSH